MYDRYQKARQGLNIEEAMVIKISALDVTGFAKLLRTVYIDENAACRTPFGSVCGIYRVYDSLYTLPRSVRPRHELRMPFGYDVMICYQQPILVYV